MALVDALRTFMYVSLWGKPVISVTRGFKDLIKQLFRAGEQGFAYDINDLSTLYQDAAGTIPVTGAGQPVGLILDKSGRNNHAYQTTSASRPLLQRNATTGAYYLAFDGVDDFLVTNSIDFTATDGISLFTGVRKLSDAATGMLIELSYSVTPNNGTFNMVCPNISSPPYAVTVSSKGSLLSRSTAPLEVAEGIAGIVISSKLSIATDYNVLNLNHVNTYSSVSDQGAGNYGNYPLYIGRRGGTSLPLNGHIYSLIGIGRLTSDSETTALEKAIAKNVGVAL